MDAFLQNRVAAGRELARCLLECRKRADVIVLAVPRGGVPIGAEIARALHVPMDILVVRRLGIPHHEKLAIGAVASGGVRVFNAEIVDSLGISSEAIEALAAREQDELALRMRAYRGERLRPTLEGKRVILVDDGVATGATMRAAIAAVRLRAPRKVLVAVPVVRFETLAQLRREADELVCLATPQPFHATAQCHVSFPALSDDDVRRVLLERWAADDAAACAASAAA